MNSVDKHLTSLWPDTLEQPSGESADKVDDQVKPDQQDSDVAPGITRGRGKLLLIYYYAAVITARLSILAS